MKYDIWQIRKISLNCCFKKVTSDKATIYIRFLGPMYSPNVAVKTRSKRIWKYWRQQKSKKGLVNVWQKIIRKWNLTVDTPQYRISCHIWHNRYIFLLLGSFYRIPKAKAESSKAVRMLGSPWLSCHPLLSFYPLLSSAIPCYPASCLPCVSASWLHLQLIPELTPSLLHVYGAP